MHDRPRRVSHGFTLLELLLAVALTGSLTAALFGGMSIVLNTRASAESELGHTASARIAMSIVQDQLNSVVMPAYVGQNQDKFVGTNNTNREGDPADTLLFHSSSLALPTGEAGSDRYRIELALAEATTGPDEGTYQLVQRVTNDLEADISPEPTLQILQRNVASLNFRYYDGSDWVDTWDDSEGEQDDNLPRAVEVVVVLADRDGLEDEAVEDVDLERLVRIIPLPISTTSARGF